MGSVDVPPPEALRPTTDMSEEIAPELEEEEMTIISFMENRINRDFGRALTDKMFSYDDHEQEIQEFKEVNKHDLLKVTIRAQVSPNYSSMIVDLTIVGVNYLVQAFHGDFDTFRTFFDPLVYPALSTIVGSEFANQLYSQVTFSPRLQVEFSSPSGDSPQGGMFSQASEKARFVWALTNTSLLVPVILALLVMGLVFLELNATRNIYNTAIQSAIEHQTKLLEEDRVRLENNNRLLEALILERLQTPTITPTSTITGTATPNP